MISLLFAFTFGVLSPLEQCQLLYDKCAINAIEQQNEFNRCILSKGHRPQEYQLFLIDTLNIKELNKFDDAATCQNHLAHCGYYVFQMWNAVNVCKANK